MESRYSIYKAVFSSFYSGAFYIATAKEGKGSGLLYLFVIVLVSTVITFSSAAWHLNQFLDSKAVNAIVEQLPDMQFKRGQLSINKESPYVMKFQNAVSGEPRIIIFDTSGSTKTTENADMVFTRESLLIDGQTQPVPWSNLPDFVQNLDMPASAFKDFCRQVIVGFMLAGLLFVPVFFFGHAVLALLYFLCGLALSRSKLDFACRYRISVVAMTPSIVLTTLFYLFYCKPELWEFLTIPITLAYLFFAFRSIGAEANQS